MIWQLTKRDAMWWTFTPAMVILFAILTIAEHFVTIPPGKGHEAILAVFGLMAPTYLGGMVMMHLAIQSQRAVYEAALPIDTRDQWCSRVLTLIGVVWIPPLIAIAFGYPWLQALQTASVATVLVLVVKCFLLGDLELKGRHGLRFQVIFFTIAASVLVVLRHLEWIAWPPPGVVFALCGLASPFLFWWGWTRVPKSFDIVASPKDVAGRRVAARQPQPAQIEAAPREPAKRPRFVWLPLLRSIFSRPTFSPYPLSFGILVILVGHPFLGTLLLSAQPRTQIRWLMHLPIPSRRLFAWIAIPQTLAVLVGWSAGFLLWAHPLSLKTHLVGIAANLTFLYGLTFLGQLSAGRRLSRFRTTVWGLWPMLTLSALVVGVTVYFLHDTEGIERLAARAPEDLWQLTAILIIPVIATYLLAEKTFGQLEYRQTALDLAAHRVGQ